MNHYELLAIISGKYAEPEAATLLHTLEETVKKYATVFHYSQNLERKKLAYPIAHHSYGTYVLIEFDCDAGILKSIDTEMRHTNEIIRYQIVRKEKIGAPKEKEPERKEQKISASPAVPTPAPVFTHTTPPPTPEYTPAPSSPIMQVPLETTYTPNAPEKEDKVTPVSALDLDVAISASPEESPSEPIENKKKQKKVTYEDLDKKLDEILNNTIL